jgi:2'-5' RNA ligase
MVGRASDACPTTKWLADDKHRHDSGRPLVAYEGKQRLLKKRMCVRLFAGILLDDAARSYVAAAVATLQQDGVRARWVPPANWHVTLAFLGDVDDDRYAAIAAAFHSVVEHASFFLNLSVVGAFPSAKRPRVLWVGGEQSAEFNATAKAVRTAFTPLDFHFDGDDLQAHVTVGRANGSPMLLAPKLEAPIAMPVTRIALFESVRAPGGVRYVEREAKTVDGTP